MAGGYRLSADVLCDVDEFESGVKGTPSEVREATRLWRGVPFEDLDSDEARVEAARLTERLLVATETNAEALLRGGDAAEAVEMARALAEGHPLRERARLVLAEALANTGRRGEALRELDDLRRRLVTELGMDPSSAVDELYRRLLGDARSTVRRRRVHGPGPLVGRDDAVATTVRALRHHRVVTLTGPGGVGKTALALAVAADLGAGLIDLVELGPVARDEDVAPAVAAQLGLDAMAGEDWTRRITDVLAFESGVLTLDNAENVLEGVTRLVHEILRRTPLHVLITSRAPLGLPDERVLDTSPLAVDAIDGGPAVELFLARAGNVRRDGEPVDRAKAARLCRRLDGLPLAIELAAALLATRTVDEVVEDLERPLDLLRGDGGRHPGLREVLGRSFELLSPDDQRTLVHLGSFLGGFTAADAAIACGSANAHLVATTMDRLVRSSLLRREDRRYGTRYRMLEVVRDFVLEQPVGHAGNADRHAAAVLAMCEHGAVAAFGADEPAWAQRILDERSNILRAFRHLCDTNDHDGALRLAIASYVIAIPRRHLDLGELPSTAAARSAGQPDVDRALLAEALGLAADAAAFGGEPDVALELITRARAIDAPPHALRYVDAVAGDRAMFAGDIDQAVALQDRARIEFERRGQSWLAAWMASSVPLARSYGGQPDQIGHALDALADALATDCPSTIAFSRYAYAEVVRPFDPDEANQQLVTAIAEALSVDAFFVAALARLSLATDACSRGDLRTSAELHREVIAEWQRLGNWTQQWNTLRTAAIVLSRAGHHEQALTIASAVDHHATAAWGQDGLAIEAAKTAARDALGERGGSLVDLRASQLDRLEVVDETLRALERLARPGSRG